MPALERSGLSFDDLVQLPRFDAASAVTLGDRLLTAASAEGELARPIRRALDALTEDLSTLRRAAAARLASAAATDPVAVAAADRTLDDCWSALFDWLTGFSKLPEGITQGAEARSILHELYPDGLSFILLPYELEWNQSDLRLARIASETLGDHIRALGGQVFLDALIEAHARYGKLLGLPRVGPQDPTARSVAEALEGFGSALRVYALKVTAFVEIDEPETAALSQRLLEPLLHWSASPRIDVELSLH
ncbi:Hypothetical protein A7982_06377 [Minicystis rosea]|nr:Hypothetical protein A7982_06377 [Minicystis rosea]